MSLRSLLNRRVKLRGPVKSGAPPARDDYGNVVVAKGPESPLIRARRDQVGADEDVLNRDQQTRRFTYLLALYDVDGDLVAPVGRGWVVDGDDTFAIDGEPELIYRRRRPHHWEIRAIERTG